MIMEKNGFISRGGEYRVYKVGRYANRIDARRHHIANILARDREDAISEFIEYVSLKEDKDSARYILYDGRWNEIIQFN